MLTLRIVATYRADHPRHTLRSGTHSSHANPDQPSHFHRWICRSRVQRFDDAGTSGGNARSRGRRSRHSAQIVTNIRRPCQYQLHSDLDCSSTATHFYRSTVQNSHGLRLGLALHASISVPVCLHLLHRLNADASARDIQCDEAAHENEPKYPSLFQLSRR